MAADDPYDKPGNQTTSSGTGGSRLRIPSGNSTSGGGASFSRGDSLDPVRRKEGLWNPNGDTAGKSEVGARTSAGSIDGGPTSSSSDTPSTSNLKSREESPDESSEDEEGGWARNFGKNTNSTSKGRVRSQLTRPRVIAGVGTSTIVGVAFGFLSVSQGPLEFIHIAQLLEKFHFSSQQHAQDSRLFKMMRYIRDPNKPEDIRLGTVGTAVAKNIETKLKERAGYQVVFDNNGNASSILIDHNHPNYKDKSTLEIKQELINKFGIPDSSVEIFPRSNGPPDIQINLNKLGGNFFTDYFKQTKFFGALLTDAGWSKLSSYGFTRVETKRFGWNFHPINKLDAQTRTALFGFASDAAKKAKDSLKAQLASNETTFEVGGTPQPLSVSGDNTSQGQNGQPNPAAQPVADQANGIGSDVTQSGGNTTKLAADLTARATASGAAGAAGSLCMLQGLGQKIQELKFVKAILPMARKFSRIMSIGSQAKSGQSIDVVSLGLSKDLLDQKDSKGNVVSTWNQAQSIQAELGHPNVGKDIPKAGQVFTSNAALDVTNSIPGLNAVCSAASSPLGIVVQAIAAPVSFAIGAVAIGPIMSFAAGWLTGIPVDPLAAGADFGNYVNFGARIAANDTFASAGGVFLSAADTVVLKNTNNTLNNSDFQSQSLAYRIFNPYESQSLASQVIDNQAIGVPQNVARMAHSFSSIFSLAFKIPSTLFSSLAHAVPSYDYHGLKAAGFTAKDLTDPRFDNAFDNGCYVVGNCKLKDGTPISTAQSILGDPNNSTGQDLIDRVKKCFGDTVTNDGSSLNINFNTDAVNMYGPDYPGTACTDNSLDWKRVRFWIIDTATAEGFDCTQGDTSTADQSCQDVGLNDSSSSSSTSSNSTTSTTTGTLPTGSAKDIATQLLPLVQSGKIKCLASGCPDIVNTAKGISIRGGSGCQVDALDHNLVGMLLALVQMGHTFILSALCSDHHDDGLNEHAGGHAADFNTIDGTFMGPDANTPWDQAKLAAGSKLDQDVASFMPKTTEFGQIQCHPTFSFLSSFPRTYPDGCHHQHIRAGD